MSEIKEGQGGRRLDWQNALLLPLMLLAGFAYQYWYFSQGLLNISYDGFLRTFQAVEWLDDPWQFPLDLWLPFTKAALGVGMLVWPDSVYGPRLMSNLAGVLTMLAVLGLSRELFRRKGIALTAVLLSAFFAPRVILSAVPLSGIFAVLWLLLAMAAYARWLRLERDRWLFITAAFMAVATTVRYEMWAFAAAFGLFAAWRVLWRDPGPVRFRLYKIAGVAALVSAFPLYWMRRWYTERGDPLGFFDWYQLQYAKMVKDTEEFAHSWYYSMPYELGVFNLENLNILGVLALVLLWRRKRWIGAWIGPVVLAGVLMGVTSLTAEAIPGHGQWRVAVPWSLLLVPFTAYLPWHFAVKSVPAGTRRTVFFSAWTTIVLVAFHLQALHYGTPRAPAAVDEWDMDIVEHLQAAFQQVAPGRAPAVAVPWQTQRWKFIAVLSRRPELFESVIWEDFVRDNTIRFQPLIDRGYFYLLIPRYRPPVPHHIGSDGQYLYLKQNPKWNLYRMPGGPPHMDPVVPAYRPAE